MLERALQGGLAGHLGYGKHERAGDGSGNSRNGYIAKTVQTGAGPVPVQVPRDRNGTFEPVLIPKRSGRIAGGLDDMVISLYAHGMSVRDIVHGLCDMGSIYRCGRTELVRGWCGLCFEMLVRAVLRWCGLYFQTLCAGADDRSRTHSS